MDTAIIIIIIVVWVALSAIAWHLGGRSHRQWEEKNAKGRVENTCRI